jgi:peptide/nickel transport system substrate-binding protein
VSELSGEHPHDDFAKFERFLQEWSRRDFLRRVAGAGAFGALAGGSGLLEACAGGSNTQTSSNTPKKGGHVSEGWAFDIKTFNSMLSQDVYSNLCIGLFLDNLLTTKANGDLAPALATEVPKPSSDGRTYRFALNKNAKWSDGKPLTSDDVLFTYNLIFAPEYQAVASPRRGDFTQNVASITAPDPYTFVVTTKAPFAPFLAQHAQYGIMPKHVLGSLPPAAINTADFNSAPNVASGPFKFVRWDKGAQVVFERNPLYYRGAALLDRFVYKVVPSTIAVGNQLKTAEIDVGQIDPSQVAVLQNEQGFSIVGFVVPSFSFLMLQQDPAKPAGQILGDKAVRQALTYALNRDGMVKTANFGQGQVANSVEPPTSWAYNPNTKPVYKYDPAKANQLLDQAGWQKGPGGIRAKAGRKMQFTIQLVTGSPVATSVAAIIQENWKAVGIAATTKEVQFSQIVTLITDTRDFDAILIGFNFTQDPDQAQLFSSAGTRPGGFNGFDFKNDQVDKLLSEAASTVDQAKRKQLYIQYQDIMADQVPAPILYFNRFNYGVSKRVQGYGLGTFDQYGTRPWMKDVWVTDGK